MRGVLAGALGGLLAFVFARIFAEPAMQAAIDYESGRGAAAAALDNAVEPADAEIFSRGVQANLGIGAGMVLFGVAMGALFTVVYLVALGRVGRIRARVLALLVAGAGLLTVYLVPFLKYPANPPAVGHHETIGARSGLYLTMVAGSVLFLLAAVWLGRRLAPRLGTWYATLVAAAAFVVLAAVLMAVLPPLGHLPANVSEYGLHPTETPLPLADPDGGFAYPGFPADTLYEFRVNSVIAQVILWGTIGLVFGPLAERVLGRATKATTATA